MAIAAILVATIAMTPTNAFADTQLGTWISGEYLAFRSPNNASGYIHWNGSGSVDTLYGLRVTPDGGFASGYCLDSIFDWGTSAGEVDHFDARRVRTCNSSVSYTGTSYDNTSGSVLEGMQKAGVCYGPNNNNNTSASQCSNDTRAFSTVLRFFSSIDNKWHGPNPSLPNLCTKSWVIDSAGTLHSSSGGDPQDCGN